MRVSIGDGFLLLSAISIWLGLALSPYLGIGLSAAICACVWLIWTAFVRRPSQFRIAIKVGTIMCRFAAALVGGIFTLAACFLVTPGTLDVGREEALGWAASFAKLAGFVAIATAGAEYASWWTNQEHQAGQFRGPLVFGLLFLVHGILCGYLCAKTLAEPNGSIETSIFSPADEGLLSVALIHFVALVVRLAGFCHDLAFRARHFTVASNDRP